MAAIKKLPSIEYLNECLQYNVESGLLYWKHRPRKHFINDHRHNHWLSNFAGKEAGFTQSDDYGYTAKSIILDGIAYKQHRVIWKMWYEEEPPFIDHSDRDATNNRIQNLLKSTEGKNLKNKSLYKVNKSGITGVYFDKARKKWVAQIRVNRKCIRLACTEDFFEACCARRSAEIKYGFSKDHGRKAAWYYEE